MGGRNRADSGRASRIQPNSRCGDTNTMQLWVTPAEGSEKSSGYAGGYPFTSVSEEEEPMERERLLADVVELSTETVKRSSVVQIVRLVIFAVLVLLTASATVAFFIGEKSITNPIERLVDHVTKLVSKQGDQVNESDHPHFADSAPTTSFLSEPNARDDWDRDGNRVNDYDSDVAFAEFDQKTKQDSYDSSLLKDDQTINNELLANKTSPLDSGQSPLVFTLMSPLSNTSNTSLPSSSIEAQVRQCIANPPSEWKQFWVTPFDLDAWAFNLFVHGSRRVTKDRKNRVMYQVVPKSGSTAIRTVMAQTYHYLGNDKRIWHKGQGSFNKQTNARFHRVEQTEQYKDWFKFTFLIDPFEHLLTGILQVNFLKDVWRLNDWMPSDGRAAASRYFVNKLDKEMLLFSSLLDEAMRTGNANGHVLDIHLAPQSWLLRNSFRLGIELDVIDKLGQFGWDRMVNDAAKKGFNPPPHDGLAKGRHIRVGSGRRILKTKYSFSQLMVLVKEETRVWVCNLLRMEYECLGFDWNTCGKTKLPTNGTKEL